MTFDQSYLNVTALLYLEFADFPNIDIQVDTIKQCYLVFFLF